MTLARKELARTGFRPAEPKPAKGAKPKTCKVCRSKFTPRTPLQVACGMECAIEQGKRITAAQKAKQDRLERAETKRKLEEHKPLEYWLKKAEAACNAYIRERDPDVCISCGVTSSSAWQAGHFVSVGANRTLRFNEDNIHKQCIHCNMHKGSNALEYRPRLIAKIGLERVEWLEGWHAPVKMTRESAQEIERHYKDKLKKLRGRS